MHDKTVNDACALYSREDSSHLETHRNKKKHYNLKFELKFDSNNNG